MRVNRSWALGGYHPIDDPPFDQIALPVALAFWHVFAEDELVSQLVGLDSTGQLASLDHHVTVVGPVPNTEPRSFKLGAHNVFGSEEIG